MARPRAESPRGLTARLRRPSGLRGNGSKGSRRGRATPSTRTRGPRCGTGWRCCASAPPPARRCVSASPSRGHCWQPFPREGPPRQAEEEMAPSAASRCGRSTSAPSSASSAPSAPPRASSLPAAERPRPSSPRTSAGRAATGGLLLRPQLTTWRKALGDFQWLKAAARCGPRRGGAPSTAFGAERQPGAARPTLARARACARARARARAGRRSRLTRAGAPQGEEAWAWEAALLSWGARPHLEACRSRWWWQALAEGAAGDCPICLDPLEAPPRLPPAAARSRTAARHPPPAAHPRRAGARACCDAPARERAAAAEV